MVDTNFTLVSGTYVDEQELLSELDFFMINTIGGWERVKVVADISTDKNIAYYTDGSEPGTYDRFWLRIRATADNLRFNGLSNFDATTDTDSDQFGGTSGNTELEGLTGSGIYWFAANKDAVHIVVERASDNVSLHGGFGHFLTCYTPVEDPKPFYVFGQPTSSYDFSNTRLKAYQARSWGTSYQTTYSGLSVFFTADHPAEVSYGTPNPRQGSPKLIEPVFVNYSDATALEVRGQVPGLYMCGGLGLSPGGLVSIKNMPPTISGSYLIHKASDTVAWALGPVTVSGSL